MKQAKGFGQRKKYSVPKKRIPIGDTKYTGRQKKKENEEEEKEKGKGPQQEKKQHRKEVKD